MPFAISIEEMGKSEKDDTALSRFSRLSGKNFHFAMAFTSLSVLAFVGAMDATILPCAMPVIHSKHMQWSFPLLTSPSGHCSRPTSHFLRIFLGRHLLSPFLCPFLTSPHSLLRYLRSQKNPLHFHGVFLYRLTNCGIFEERSKFDRGTYYTRSWSRWHRCLDRDHPHRYHNPPG
jgi:hypothetical protein